MQRSRFIIAAALMMCAAGARAATTTVVNTDFTLQDPKRLPINWTLNGTAQYELSFQGTTVTALDVALTEDTTGEGAAIWTNDTFTLPSFTMWADVNVDFHPRGAGVDPTCPADGFALAFANTPKPDTIGTPGGNLGIFGNDAEIPQFIGFEVNTWYGQDLDDTSTCTTGKNVTFAFEDIDSSTGTGRSGNGDVNAGGAKVGQVTAPDVLQKGLINGGWYRYQWDVDTATGKMDAYLTGLDATNKAIQNMKLAEVTFASSAPKLAFKGRFGMGAGTGGGTEGVRVRQVVVVSPAVPAGSPPTAGQ